MNRFSSLILALPLAAAPAYAQSTDTKDSAAPAAAQSNGALEQAQASDAEVTVTAGRLVQRLDTVGQAVTVLDSTEIARRQSAIVSDLLRQTPGVTVIRNGGVGTVTSVSIRGAQSDQTAALIDGIKLNDPSTPAGGFDFGQLLVGNIARIEVVRGAQSVLWGSQAIGGVVNIITRQPTEQLTLNARAEGGTYGTGQAFANVSGKAGPLRASIGGGWYQTNGISAFAGGRESDGFRHYAGNASVNLALTNTLSVDLRGFYADSRTDIDGFAPPTFTFGDTPEYSVAKQALGYAGVNWATQGGRLRNRIGYALTNIRRRNLDPSAGTPRETFASTGRNIRFDYQGVLDLGRVTATFGAEREISRYATGTTGGPISRARASIDSGYGQLLVSPLAGLNLTGGVRYDSHNRFGGIVTGAASGVYTRRGTTLRGSWTQGFKAPSLFQLQSDFGNPLLRPETSEGWDIGLAQRLLGGRIEASATWFSRTARDQIIFVSCPRPLTGICTGRPFGTYDNVARASAEGLEATLALRPTDALTLTASYSYIDSRARAGADAGRRLPNRPSQSFTLNLDHRWRFGLETGATLVNLGPSFNDGANRVRLAGYTLLDLRAAFPVARGVQIYGRVENAFDTRYQTISQYGQPGRAVYGGVRVGL
jgi:vitamin B12 transporter